MCRVSDGKNTEVAIVIPKYFTYVPVTNKRKKMKSNF
jgi:hypothetical protein